MHAPPVVHDDIEDGEEDDQECGRPLGLETHGDHDAGGEPDQREDQSCKGPLSLEGDSDEKEDQKDSACQLEVFLAIIVAQIGKSRKEGPTSDHRIGKDHEETSNNGEVAQEEINIKDETVTKALQDDDTQKTANCDLRVALGDDGTRGSQHGEDVQKEENLRNAPWEVAVFLEIPVLVSPLSENAKGILNKSHDNEETTNCREMRLEGLRVNLDHVLNLGGISSDFL